MAVIWFNVVKQYGCQLNMFQSYGYRTVMPWVSWAVFYSQSLSQQHNVAVFFLYQSWNQAVKDRKNSHSMRYSNCSSRSNSMKFNYTPGMWPTANLYYYFIKHFVTNVKTIVILRADGKERAMKRKSKKVNESMKITPLLSLSFLVLLKYNSMSSGIHSLMFKHKQCL